MDTSIDQLLTTLVLKVAEHFGFEPQVALAEVAQWQVADELTKHGNPANLSLDQICQKLYKEISMADFSR